jgi:hypothetical protein
MPVRLVSAKRPLDDDFVTFEQWEHQEKQKRQTYHEENRDGLALTRRFPLGQRMQVLGDPSRKELALLKELSAVLRFDVLDCCGVEVWSGQGQWFARAAKPNNHDA